MHSKKDTTKIMMNNKTNEIIEELFDTLKNRSQNNLESMSLSLTMFSYCIINVIK